MGKLLTPKVLSVPPVPLVSVTPKVEVALDPGLTDMFGTETLKVNGYTHKLKEVVTPPLEFMVMGYGPVLPSDIFGSAVIVKVTHELAVGVQVVPGGEVIVTPVGAPVAVNEPMLCVAPVRSVAFIDLVLWPP